MSRIVIVKYFLGLGILDVMSSLSENITSLIQARNITFLIFVYFYFQYENKGTDLKRNSYHKEQNLYSLQSEWYIKSRWL
jgi:hypothetical protein